MKSSMKILLRALAILIVAAGLGWGIYAVVESAGSAQPDSISSAQGYGAGAHGRPPATPGARLLGFALSLAKFAAFFLAIILLRGLIVKKAPEPQPCAPRARRP
jgi:hypothetical protein